jgi:aerobic C4-dicarboxylate transport protein
MTNKPLYRSLYFQVIVAIVIGIGIGHFYPDSGAAMKPLGDGFIKLIKMMIAPIIFCTVVTGISGMENMKKGVMKLEAQVEKNMSNCIENYMLPVAEKVLNLLKDNGEDNFNESILLNKTILNILNN